MSETRAKRSKALTILRRQSADYNEFVKLRSYINSTKKKLYSGTLGEVGSFNYYIRRDRYKELKNILKTQGLL